MARLGGAPTSPIPPYGRPNSGILRRCMYRTTVWRKELIKQFIRYEIMIVLGDLPKIRFKVHFLAGPSLKKYSVHSRLSYKKVGFGAEPSFS